MANENEIYTSQVRDANNVTLDIILANLTAQTAVTSGSANTVEVSANGGSTLFAHSLNFVNTANVTVVVTDNGDGNANVSFSTLSGSVSGSNGWLQFNNNSNFGATQNITYNIAINTLTANGTVNVTGGFNLNGVNVAAEIANITAMANGDSIYSQGSLTVSNTTSLNFLNSPTINVAVSANGTQANLLFSVNTTAVTANAGTVIDYSAVATTNQSSFTMTANATSAAFVLVTINGLLQIPGTNYSVVNNALTLTSNCVAGDVVDTRIFTTGAQTQGGGAVTPGGANTWVQFNDSGQFGGSSNLFYNKTNNTLQIISGNVVVNGVNILTVLEAAYAAANAAANTTTVSANLQNFMTAHKLNFNNTQSTQVLVQDVGNGNANISFSNEVIIMIPMGAANININSAIVVQQAVNYIRSPKTFTITNVSTSLSQSSSSGNVSVQIRKNGTNVMSTPCNIASGATTSLSNALQPVVSTPSVTLDDVLQFDISANGTNAIGLIATIRGFG